MKKNKTAVSDEGLALALRTPAAARASGMSERTIQRLIKSRELPSVRVGKIRLIRKKALEDFLAQREEATAS
jgi:excisionase family DNA binding protein